MTDNQLPLDDDTILIELAGPGGSTGFVRAGRVEETLDELKLKSEVAMNKAMSTLHATARKVSRTIRAMEKDSDVVLPSELEMEFALTLEQGLGTEAGADAGVVAKITTDSKAGGQFTVRFKWSSEKPNDKRE
jgi:hypothetical protein